MTPVPPENATRQAIEVPVQLIAGIGVALTFLLLRLGVIWQAPVGGDELESLSGAWQAASGNGDTRFVPTLFQAIAALLLDIRDTEVLPRLLAYGAIATVPAVFHLLKPVFGAGAALVGLLLLAFDGPSVYLGVAASTSAFDLPLMAWTFLLIARPDLRERVPVYAYGVAGFGFATAGAMVLPLLFALAATDSFRTWQRPSPTRIALVSGAAIGLLVANLGFGYGWDGLVIPPVTAFVAAFDLDTPGLSAADIVIVYSWPLLIAGIAGATLLLRQRHTLSRPEWLVLVWLAFGLAWLIAAAAERTVVPVAALSLPLALVGAPAVLMGLSAARDADWHVARFVVPAGALLAVIAGAYAADWGRLNAAGDAAEIARVVALGAAAVAAFAVAGVEARSRGSLAVPGLFVGGLVLVIGGLGVGLSAVNEPVPAPNSADSARVLRSLALEIRAERGGEIVLHPDFQDDIVWPFRDSGDLVIASRVPAEASVVIWPVDMAQPDGFVLVEGDWALLDTPAAPTSSWLQYIRWYVDRNSLSVSHTRVAVYIRPEQ